jgi:hypothetical protein
MSLETEKYGVCTKEHAANCPLRWRLSNGGCKLDLIRERDGGGKNVLKVGKQPSPFFTPLTFPTLHTYEGRWLLPLNDVALRCHS